MIIVHFRQPGMPLNWALGYNANLPFQKPACHWYFVRLKGTCHVL
jgi:hypothetical protein